uniref:Uncharacterized protein n=1 Tax=viral metagenome TaxID=1070528 RepID=A0A6M3KSF1_9ZZZZ
MSLPKQVEEAGKRADAIAAEMTKGDNPGKPAENATPPETPETTTEQVSETVESVEEQLKAAQHKYNVLKGKYDSEIVAIKDDVNLLNRLKGENKALKDQNRQLVAAKSKLSTEIDDLKKKAEQKTPAASAEPTGDLSTHLTKEELDHLEGEELGGKTLEIFKKLIRATAGTNTKTLEERINKIDSRVDSVDQRVTQTSHKTWEQQLKDAIPDFAAINSDQRFIDWLRHSLSPLTTQTRADALQAAINAQDLQTLKVGIDEFKKEAGLVKPKKQEPKPKVRDLNSQIEPGESVSSTPTPISTGKTYKIAEVRKFYSDFSKGKWRGREAEAKAIDNDIVLAQQEGRIT